MNLEEKSKLKLIFVDIINGFSHETLEGNKIYLKHLNTFDSGDIESVKDFFHKKAVKAGLPSRSDKLRYLETEDLWTSKEENEIKSIKNFITTLKNTKRKLFKSKDIDSINGQIKTEENKLDDLKLQRKKLIGFTAEDYSSKRSNEHIIYVSLYKDSSLKERLFSEKDFRDLEEEDLSKFGEIYLRNSVDFSSLNLKKIALLPFYKNIYNLSSDNPYFFYGKRVLDLSFHQIEVFCYARYFSNILSQAKNPPEEYLENPDKLIEWADSSKNAEELLNSNKTNSQADGRSLVGATKEDLERAGIKNEGGVSIFDEAKKNGGSLSMEDMMKLHGIK